MTNYRPIDSKREEFRKYLERAGVMDALTKALVTLYEQPEKPTDALDFVRKALGDTSPDLPAMQAELDNSKATIEALQAEIKSLKEQLGLTDEEGADAAKKISETSAPAPEGGEEEHPPTASEADVPPPDTVPASEQPSATL